MSSQASTNSLPSSAAHLDAACARTGQIVLGKAPQIRLALACLVSGGHLLIEDMPGVGKTTLAHTLAKVLALSFRRIQFTSDLLPADIIGSAIFERDSGQFIFRKGALFTQLLLADEVNRATPKTQSALLEAMAEGQATVDGTCYPLPTPFFVIATQNPQTQIGTFALPESQLDRFTMRISLGYPPRQAERALLAGADPREHIESLDAVLDAPSIIELQHQARAIITTPALLDYIQDIVTFTRRSGRFITGLSPRAALHLKWAAQSWALMADRRGVLPEDVQAVLANVVNHRLIPREAYRDTATVDASTHILESVAVP